MNSDLKKKTTSGLIWSVAEKVLTQGFSFVIGIVMARLLSPSDYGYVVIATMVISFPQALVEGGLTNALIQRKDTDEGHNSTMMYYMLGLSLIFYAILFVSAPFIATYYKVDILEIVLRVYGITLPISALRAFFMAIMQKNLRFRLQFFSSFFGTVISGVIGIILAVYNYGIWALVIYVLMDQLVDSLIMWICLKWRPRLYFSFEKLKDLYSFAKYSLGWNLVNQYTNLIIDLAIGKKYTSEDLSFYDRGKKYPFLMCSIVNNAMGTTLFPVFSKIGDDIVQLKSAMRRSIKLIMYIQLPMLFGFIVIANPLVNVLLTDKWLPCVPFLQITCITYSFWPYLTCYRNAIEANGEVKITFRNEVIVTICRIILCGIAVFISPLAVAIAFMMVWGIDAFITGLSTKKVLNYTFMERIVDVLPTYICSGIMAILVYISGKWISVDILKVLVQIIVGIVSYIILSIVTKNENLSYAVNILIKRKNK